MLCPLCGDDQSKLFSARKRRLTKCIQCHLVFSDPADRSSPDKLRERYLLHQNSIEDKGYCEFLSRAIDLAMPFLPSGARGLDYGCGPTPTLSKLLQARGYSVTDYDPLFFGATLAGPYDFIFSTECFEHFDEPKHEITKIVKLLKPGGVLTIMTELWDAGTDFDSWHYTSDPTHVSFYAKETLATIAETFSLKQLASDGKRVFVFVDN